MGGGGGLGFFIDTIGAKAREAINNSVEPFSGGTLVAAAAHLGTATDAGGGIGGKSSTKLTIKQAFAGALGNIMPSAKAFGSDFLSVLLHPGQTIDGLSNIIVGYVHQATGKQSEKRAYADAVTIYFYNRYGSMANIKQTLSIDPVGFAADMSLFLTGGSGTLRSAAKAASIAAKIAPIGKVAQGTSKAAGALSKAGETLGKAGNIIDPLTGVEKSVRAVSPQVLKKLKLSSDSQKMLKKGGTAAARSRTAVGIGTTQHTIEREQTP